MPSERTDDDVRTNPKPGDVLRKQGVTREITHQEGDVVRSYFTSSRWKHTEWTSVRTFRGWAKGAEVLIRG